MAVSSFKSFAAALISAEPNLGPTINFVHVVFQFSIIEHYLAVSSFTFCLSSTGNQQDGSS